MKARHLIWAGLAGGLVQLAAPPVFAQATTRPAGTEYSISFTDQGARVLCHVGRDQKVIACEIRSGGEGLTEAQRTEILARAKVEVERGDHNPPVIVPAPPPPTVPPPLQAAPPQQRREYVGPPVILPGPPPPPAPYVGARPRIITNPQWLRRPDSGDLERYFPPAARAANINGRATIECRVTANGSLTGCSVISESPAGMAFGEATIRASSKFRMRPRTVDGSPVEGARVRVTLVWNLGDPVVAGGGGQKAPSPGQPPMLRKDAYPPPPVLVPRVSPAPTWGSQPRPLGVQDGFLGEWNTERAECGGTRRGSRLVITATTVEFGRREWPLLGISNPRPRVMVVETARGGPNASTTFELTADGTRVDERTRDGVIQRFKCPERPAG